MEAIGLDKLRLTRPENELITEKTYIKKRMNLFMCVKCDMICAESIPIPEGSTLFADKSETKKFVNEEERRKKTQTQRVYCLACDEKYSDARRKYDLIKHWLCCCFLCDN
jgi:hypothetical protein